MSVILLAIKNRQPSLLLAALIQAYSLAWFGHFEKKIKMKKKRSHTKTDVMLTKTDEAHTVKLCNTGFEYVLEIFG